MKSVYCIPKWNQISHFLHFSNEYNAGFEYNDFFLPSVLDNPKQVQKMIENYKSLDRDRSEDTLHGAFLDVCVHSDDAKILEVSDLRIHQSMDIAVKLGVKAVIFHTNMIPNFRLKSYCSNWVNRNAAYWRRILAEYPTLTVYLENMFDGEPTLLSLLAAKMADEPRFGVCFDMAHAFLADTPLNQWCDALRPYICHMHINDNDGLEDTHRPVGTEKLPWEIYGDFMASIPKEKRPTVLIEVRTYEDLMESVEYLKKNHLYPL
ncbi:MAG: TIM barrel protein [Lachnospiraceae bacterium]|nr:TIM barrel protein [Lachnospiraceae bacterium]